MSNRIKVVLVGLLFFCATISSHAQETNAVQTIEELRAQLTAYVEQPRFSSALWGIKIISLNSEKNIFDYHADRLMNLAAGNQLYFAALALDRFGTNYRIVTPVFATSEPGTNGIVHGDVVISGRGDPSWNARYAGTNFWNLFRPFISALRNAGVQHITGDLIGDTTFFHSPPTDEGWSSENTNQFQCPEIPALTLADNLAQIRVSPALAGEPCQVEIVEPFTNLQLDNQTITTTNGTTPHIVVRRFQNENVVHVFGALPADGETELLEVSVPHPAQWFITALKEALRQYDIIIDGDARTVSWPSPLPTAHQKISQHSSPPMGKLVNEFMKSPQILEANLIFKLIGETSRSADVPARETSEQCALDALTKLFQTNGTSAGDLHFDKTAGISDNDLTTANATVALLKFMTKHPTANDFIAALPIAGVDGTIANRMTNTPAENNVRAFASESRWATTLSGFLTTAAGEKLAFSLMLNRYDAPANRKPSDELDNLAVMLTRFAGRTDESLGKIYAPFGTMIVTQFVSAPFPHPARAQGRTRYGLFYSAKEHYSDSTVAMFIPKGFRPTDKVDFVVHFHGWNNTVAGTLEQFNLVQQFYDSGKNAIFIIPEIPHIAPDSFGGKLEDTNGFKIFMAEAVEKLKTSGALGGTNFEIGNIILSGHSGGYHAMAGIVDRGGLPIAEAWLFDALYGNVENFVAWQKNENGRMLNIYTDHGGTTEESENLMASYKTNGVPFTWLEETNSATTDLTKSKIVFIHTDLTHGEVIFKRNEYEQFLKTSCLKDR